MNSGVANGYIADSGFELGEVAPARGILVSPAFDAPTPTAGNTMNGDGFLRPKGLPEAPAAVATRGSISFVGTGEFHVESPVTTPLSRDAGIFTWGFPKTIEASARAFGDRAAFNLRMDGEEVFSYSVPANGSTTPPPVTSARVLDLGRWASR